MPSMHPEPEPLPAHSVEPILCVSAAATTAQPTPQSGTEEGKADVMCEPPAKYIRMNAKTPVVMPDFAKERIAMLDTARPESIVTPKAQGEVPAAREQMKKDKLFASPIIDSTRVLPSNFDPETFVHTGVCIHTCIYVYTYMCV